MTNKGEKCKYLSSSSRDYAKARSSSPGAEQTIEIDGFILLTLVVVFVQVCLKDNDSS